MVALTGVMLLSGCLLSTITEREAPMAVSFPLQRARRPLSQWSQPSQGSQWSQPSQGSQGSQPSQGSQWSQSSQGSQGAQPSQGGQGAQSSQSVKVETTALVEALLAQQGVKVQAVNGSYRDEVFQANCVLKSDGEKLTAVFLTPVMRLVTITVTKPHAIHCERAPQIPRAFEPEYALIDLAFVNLPPATLRRCVEPQLRVEERKDGVRITAAEGTPIAELRIQADGSRVYRNVVFGYEYVLRDAGK